ncbi:MAG: AlpA family transcriptional regulator [Rhizobiaceae bacterium]|nr:AlpA family transcriptional regulator [Rhizobiaceae bacterium]
MIDRILRRREVEACTGLSRATIYEGIANGEFPRPVKIGRRAVGWPESVVADWLANRPLTASSQTDEVSNGWG